MHIKIVSIHDTESVNVPKNTLESCSVICSLVLRRGFLIRCAILVIYVPVKRIGLKIHSEEQVVGWWLLRSENEPK